jgi:hypothetical protein
VGVFSHQHGERLHVHEQNEVNRWLKAAHEIMWRGGRGIFKRCISKEWTPLATLNIYDYNRSVIIIIIVAKKEELCEQTRTP